MPKVIILLTLTILLAACHRDTQDNPLLVEAPSLEDVEELYAPYTSGEYDKFVSQMYSLQVKSENYRQQMTAMMKQQVFTSRQEHGTLKSITAVHVEQSKAHPLYADAYLLMTYQEGDSEQVCVPLVYAEGRWWIK